MARESADFSLITPKRTDMINAVVERWCSMYSLTFRYWRLGCIDETSCSFISRRRSERNPGVNNDDFGDVEDRLDCLAFIVGQLRGQQFTTPEIRKVLEVSAGTCHSSITRYRAMPEETRNMMLQASGLKGKEAVRSFTQGTLSGKKVHNQRRSVTG
jgi:hypothetical protein